MSQPLQSVVRFLRSVCGAFELSDVPDVRLLSDFALRQDQRAFNALVLRHGPMVWGVCRRLLGHTQDAEDAFQATFLVLARRAGSLGQPRLLGNWLYGVAYRTAMAGRTRRHRRKEEPVGIDVSAPEEVPAADWDDLREVLDQEIRRLPDKYRIPFVLCHLEGITNEEAAQIIGCPAGTVMSRLATAREKLRSRLTRRGVGPAAAGGIYALTSASADGAPVSSFPAASMSVAALAQGVLNTMFLMKLGTTSACVLAIGLVIAGSGWLAYRSSAAPTDGSVAVAVPVEKTESAEPTAQQLQEAKKAFGSFGGVFRESEDALSKRKVFAFVMPPETDDKFLGQVPAVAFPFGLVFSGGRLTPDGLKNLTRVPNLITLSFFKVKFGDEELKELAPLEQLVSLKLAFSQVTDNGLKVLPKMKSLRQLSLTYSLQVKDAGAKELGTMSGLSSLDISFTKVTDRGLKDLTSLKRLRSLDLAGTPVTDGGLKDIASIRSLSSLRLSGTRVTDAGLKEIANLKGLTSFSVGHTKVSDAGLKELAGLEGLDFLEIADTQVTDAGLKDLAGLRHLSTLMIFTTKVSDVGLRALAEMKDLTTLHLAGTAVTDAGLKELMGLPKLTSVILRGTAVTDAGVASLQDALPKCKIAR